MRTHLAALLALALLVWAPARAPAQRSASPPLQSATAAFQAGSEAFARGDLERGRAEFARAVALAPKIPAAHAALGSVLRELNRLGEAQKELNAALQLNPNEPTALLNLAVVQARLGGQPGGNIRESTLATQTLDHFRALSPTAPGLTSSAVALPLASALVAAGRPAEAEALLAESQIANPADPALADALGAVLAGERRYDEAELQSGHALTLDPAFAPAYAHLGSIKLERNSLDEAVANLQQAHSLEPRNTQYSVNLAHALLLTGADEAAVQLLRNALAGNEPAQTPVEKDDLRYQLALALQSVGEVREALPLFRQLVLARPRDPNVLTNAGLAEVQNGDAPAGIALYRRALAIAPTPTLREDLGVAFLQQDHQTDALVQFREGLKLEPDSPQLHYDLGLALKLKDDLAGAVPEFEKATQLDPSLPDPPYTLGVIYMQQGRFTEAAKSLARATELRPDNGEAWATLGSVYRQLDQPDKAEPALRRAILLLPDQPSPHITLAALLAAQGKREEAAAERKRGADLTRIAVNRQKAQFLIDSGTLLLKRRKLAEALGQLQEAVATDPTLPAGHAALAEALDRSGRKGEAALERRKATQ